VAYWTEPGEYTITATYIYNMDEGKQMRLVSAPLKVKVVKE